MVMEVVVRNLRLRRRRKDRERDRVMELSDVFHYLNVIRDVAKAIETDDPALTQHLSYITGIVEGHTSAALASGAITQDATNKVSDAVQAVKDTAPSASTQDTSTQDSSSAPPELEVKPVE